MQRPWSLPPLLMDVGVQHSYQILADQTVVNTLQEIAQVWWALRARMPTSCTRAEFPVRCSYSSFVTEA